MNRLRLAVPALILAGGLLVPTTLSFGKPEYTKKEKKACNICHTKGKELNAVGQCYGKSHTLQGCEAK